MNTTHLTDVTNEVAHSSSSARGTPMTTPSSCESSSQQLFSSQSLFRTPLRFSHSLYQHALPSFQWADGSDVWHAMLEKETKLTFRRDPDMFERHAGLDARMRSILLDWLIEVIIFCDITYISCEVSDREPLKHHNSVFLILLELILVNECHDMLEDYPYILS